MCAIFGVLDYQGKLTPAQRLRMVKELGTAAEVRGKDATGIAYFQRDRLCIQKAPKAAHKMRYRLPAEVRYIMGHTRMTTQGNPKQNQNNHPFPGKAGSQSFALAHNGVLYNDKDLRRTYKLPPTAIATDSYVAVQLIEAQKEVSPDSLRRMAEVLRGSYTFTVLDQDNCLYFVKGENPLTIYHYPTLGLYLYASTEGILFEATNALGMGQLEPEIIEPWDGEILRIDRHGHRSSSEFTMRDSSWGNWPFRSAWTAPRPRKKPVPPCYHSQRQYIQDLKSVAWCYGYEPEYVEQLVADGYTAEDVEELFYSRGC